MWLIRLLLHCIIVFQQNPVQIGILGKSLDIVAFQTTKLNISSLQTTILISFKSCGDMAGKILSLLSADGPLIFRQLLEATSCTFTYLIGDSVTRQAALIDPVLDTVDRDTKLVSSNRFWNLFTELTFIAFKIKRLWTKWYFACCDWILVYFKSNPSIPRN